MLRWRKEQEEAFSYSCYIEFPVFKFVMVQVVHTLSVITDFISSAYLNIDTLVDWLYFMILISQLSGF